jgi:hypothetical protein
MAAPLVIGLALAIAVFGVIANHAKEMFKDRKYQEMFGTIFWAVIPIAIFCVFWVISENPSIMARNITLGIVGAVLGASALIWAGYVASHLMWPAKAQSTPNTESPMTGKNSLTITGSNNTVTVDHIGDVNVPGPELKLSATHGKQESDGSFAAVFDVQIVAPYTPGSLRIEAWAPGITRLDVVPQRTGAAIFGHSGVRPDHAFSTVMQPFGHYKIYVLTKAPTNVEIRYLFDQ